MDRPHLGGAGNAAKGGRDLRILDRGEGLGDGAGRRGIRSVLVGARRRYGGVLGATPAMVGVAVVAGRR